MAVCTFSIRILTLVFAISAAAAPSHAAELPCGHPQSAPTASAQIKIEGWKEPRLVEEFRNFGRKGEFIYFDGPLYVPVAGKPADPKIFKSWQLQKPFESPLNFILLDVSNSPGDGVYTLQLYHCATSQAWEPIWKDWMEIVDAKVGVERLK